MVPHIADVSNVIWYNVDMLAEHDITPPESWEDLLDACDTLSAAGIVPIASGNKDFWAAGNWLGHLVSRVVGADVYDSALSGESSFDTPEWKEAFGYIEDLHEHGCVNESVNAIDDNEGAQLFFQEKAAMHAIGSWLVSWAIDEAPDLDFDFVNLPAMPAEVDADSVEGVITGHVVNAKSSPEKIEKAAEFLAMLHTPENTEEFIAAEAVPVDATASECIDERTVRLNSLLGRGRRRHQPRRHRLRPRGRGRVLPRARRGARRSDVRRRRRDAARRTGRVTHGRCGSSHEGPRRSPPHRRFPLAMKPHRTCRRISSSRPRSRCSRSPCWSRS